MFASSASGDANQVRRLLDGDRALGRLEYAGRQPIHFAVAQGHLEIVHALLDAGADPGLLGPSNEDLAELARTRGHDSIAELLEARRAGLARIEPNRAATHPVHEAARADDATQVRAFLDAEPALIGSPNEAGGTPLHSAVAASARETAELLLDRGADPHALHGAGPGSDAGYAPTDFQPVDVALWGSPFWNPKGDVAMARLLCERGVTRDLVLDAAFGDVDAVEARLRDDPGCVDRPRPNGKRALSTSIDFGHDAIARTLLEHGADPNAREGPTAPRGTALYSAARAGNLAMVELLLAHGADPGCSIDSSGSAAFVARTAEVRSLLLSQGAVLDAYDLAWLDEDDEVLRRVREDPRAADVGCGGVLAAVCKQGKRELLDRLLDAGARVAPMVTGCRSYLLGDPEMLRMLLASGMNPDLPNWVHATPLHDLCGRDGRGRARPDRVACAEVLLDAGASFDARDLEYRSTPLAWAARSDLPEMVELLLARGAPASSPDDVPWATPLAWARRVGSERIERLLEGA